MYSRRCVNQLIGTPEQSISTEAPANPKVITISSDPLETLQPPIGYPAILKYSHHHNLKMAHSKRNTSLPHFTSYERGLLRSTWGTKRSVIGRDSFLPFASCKLCLQPARSPVVSCSTNGDFLEREREDAKKRLAEDEERVLEEARLKDLHDFELVSMGLEARKAQKSVIDGGGGAGRKRKAEEEDAIAKFKAREVEVNGTRKKVFELDDKEMERVAREERERLKDELKKQKVGFFVLPYAPWMRGSTRGQGGIKLTGISLSRVNRHYHHSGFHH